MSECLQLKNAGKHVGKIGVTFSDLWGWSLSYRMPRTSSEFGASQALHITYDRDAMVEEKKLQLVQSLGSSCLLTRLSLWPMKEIPQNLKAKNV